MLNSSELDKRFRKLFQDGKLVQVHVGKWGMSHQLTQEDLSLDTQEEQVALPEFMQLGKKWLFTNEVRQTFTRLESKARKFLLDNSHKFEIADAHFVPVKLLVKVLTTLNEYKVQYDKAADDFVANYDKHKQEMFEKYPDHRAQLEPYYPAADTIRPKFYFYITVFEVAFPKQLKELSMEEIIAQNIAIEKAKKKYDTYMEEQYKQSVSQMQSFVKEAAVALRNEVIKGFQALADKINRREVITATNLNTIKSIVEDFENLDFFDDEKVKQKLKEVKRLVASGQDFKDDAEAIEKLKIAVTETLTTAQSITDIDTLTGGYIRRLDLSDL